MLLHIVPYRASVDNGSGHMHSILHGMYIEYMTVLYTMYGVVGVVANVWEY